jgi:2-phospho-L-lactate/phosphoenolpyruvate guanylyltransferase
VHERDWVVVVPIKTLATAKTRLRGAPLRAPHADLVLAMAQDTVAASVACPTVAEVLVVTDDPVASGALASLGARVVSDAPAAGLNPALAHGASLAAPGRPVAALAADLPALRPSELGAALRAASHMPDRGFVVDAAGSGTTMLAARPGVPLDPRFGAGSARAHQESGARRLDGDWPTLSRDVDTLTDLIEAGRLGLGARTAALAGAELAAR